MSYRTAGIAIGVIIVLGYLIALPIAEDILEQFEEKATVVRIDEELSFFDATRIRSIKLVVFAIFAYVGACIGSFFNVVAASAPRGEPIAIRTSSCPRCKTPIGRWDNLPIISYLMLKGRCRSCSVGIPRRYLLVELVAAGIVGSLFLYELVTGAANIPSFRHYHYTGIMWILLYTKWPVVWIYLYHAAMFCLVLLFALMEIDRQSCPRWMALGIVAIFVGLAVCFPVLQPIALDDRIGLEISGAMPSWLSRALTCFVGGATAWTLGWGARRAGWESPSSVSLILLGVALGWQAIVNIAVIWMLSKLVLGLVRRRLGKPTWIGPTTLLLVASMLHHPFWRPLMLWW